jgi:hypothetical protein
MDNEAKKIIESLQPLFDKAEAEGLWFYTSYQNLWFSPKELKQQQSLGGFIWGANNWKLRKPEEKLASLKRVAENAQKEYEDFKNKF